MIIQRPSGLQDAPHVPCLRHITVDRDDLVVDVQHVPLRHVHVVYFANLFVNRAQGLAFVQQHLRLACQQPVWSLLQHKDVKIEWSVVISGPVDQEPSTRSLLDNEIRHLLPHVNFRLVYTMDNCHELPGLYELWAHANRERTKEGGASVYFHAKGISRMHHIDRLNRMLTTTIFGEAPVHVLEWLPSISKVAITNSQEGFCWYNFFWIRNDLLCKMERPIRTSRRHYYEDWSARVLRLPGESTPTLAPPSAAWSPVEEKETSLWDGQRYVLYKDNVFSLRGSCPALGLSHIGSSVHPQQAFGW